MLKGVGTDLKSFYSNCVSYSRACKLTDVAKTWPAFAKWRYETNAYQYLKSKAGDAQATVFVDDEVTNDQENFSGYSFRDDSIEVMSFGQSFLPKMSQNAVGMTMRDSSASMKKILEPDIIYPEFYHEYGEFVNMEVTMGQFFLDNVHYDRTD